MHFPTLTPRSFSFRRLLLTGALLGLPMGALDASLLESGDTVAICGDSITQQRQYSVMLEDYFLMCQPTEKIEAHQFGWNGERIEGFLVRIERGVKPFEPDVATMCYGMNDGLYAPIAPAVQEKYRRETHEAIAALRDTGARVVIVGSPGLVDTYTLNATHRKDVPAPIYNETLADLSRIAREVAEEEGVPFADIYTPFQHVMEAAKAKYGETYPVAGPDGIHPDANGHLVMAYAFLKALEFDGNIGTITVDLSQHEANATEGHQVQGFEGDTVTLESTRYPFCFAPGELNDPKSPRGILEFLPFNEELNRYRLVVKGASAPRYRVTWGTESREYTAEQLSAGINLAAEFLDNPFVEPFFAVQDAVQAQQDFEVPAVKEVLHRTPEWMKLLPDQQDELKSIRAATVDKAQRLADNAQQAVKPVRHEIRIEALQ